ncbi:chemotaxis protein CheD [archaeon]|nr:chemotaxis protein CheD [archaeon]
MIRVGISEIKTASHPEILSSVGLGSCVGICLYDPTIKVGGMAHVLLPSSKSGKIDGNPGKFADTAINALLQKLGEDGVLMKNIKAKLVGGASMFAISDSNDSMFSMGPKNVAAAKNVLTSRGIKLDGEHTGGSQGRTVEFHVGTGRVVIKTMVCTTEI